MRLMGQSATEFLTAYSTMLILLTVVLAALYLIATLPTVQIPQSCYFYSGFYCEDAVYALNGSHGTVLMIEADDTMPGTVNVSGFNARIGSASSTGGYCAPQSVTEGEKIYCVAHFDAIGVMGTAYSGVMNVTANFCGGAAAAITPVCPAGMQYAYGGTYRMQASNVGISTVWYAPVTISNGQAAGIPAGFQQMIRFDPSNSMLAPHETGDLGNLRFYYGGQELYSWCESGCSNSTKSAIFWVKIPVAIRRLGNLTIRMYAMPSILHYDGKYAGEAPQLTATYAQYDNGANVFEQYYNFAGNALPGTFVVDGSGLSYTVNDGITVRPTGLGAVGTISEPFDYNGTVDAFGSFSGSGSASCNDANATIGYSNASLGYAVPAGCSSQEFGLITKNSTGANVVQGSYTKGSSAVFTVQYSAKTAVQAMINYTGIVSSSNAVSAMPQRLELLDGSNSGIAITINWLRVRMTPPSGVMPSVSIGTAVPANA